MRKDGKKNKAHPTAAEKDRIIKAYRQGRGVKELADIFGYHPMTIYRWSREKQKRKKFTRKEGSGRPQKIDKKYTRKLIAIIKKPATRFGFETPLWNLKRMCMVSKKELGLKVSHMAMWRFLGKMDYTCKQVQKNYNQADEKKRDEWLQETVKKIKKTVKSHRAILYFEDESNISLSPVMGTSWSPKGEIIVAKVTGKRGSVAAISAISNDGRLVFSLHNSGKRFNSDDIIKFLGEMLSHHRRRHLVVIMDQASCHKSKKVKQYVEQQKRLHVFYLPSYSPDLNPDEQVWNHLKNNDLKCHQVNNTKDLKKLARKKLRTISKSPEKIHGIFNRCAYSKLYKF